jgi:FlaA1/EpsC-like NDP-sugar epimerase
VKLVFDAIQYGVGGEIFIPKLSAFKITDLIEILKEKYQGKNKVKIIGIRPGEKIHELMINNSEVARTYDYKNLYIISSSIQNFRRMNKPEYMIKGKLLNVSKMKEYSSKDSLISKEEVSNIFKKLGLI